jgi:hypothetical protein
MKRIIAIALLLFCLPGLAVAQAIPSTYFGLAMWETNGAWPTFPIGHTRSWDAAYGGTNFNWRDIETSSGVYTWTALDGFVAKAKLHNLSGQIIYTFGSVPGWANGSAGETVPPSDLTSAGSPNFNAFVSALVTHAVATYGSGVIKYYELWNEANNFWAGTQQQLVYLLQGTSAAIKAIDPSAIILSPSSFGYEGVPWITTYLAEGGTSQFDQFVVHAYPWATIPAPPEYMANIGAYNTYIAQSFGLTTPIWCTEFANATVGGAAADPVFLAVSYILGYSFGFSHLDWFQFNYAASVGNLAGSNQGLNVSGAAYRVVENWLSGATWTSPPARQKNANGITNTTMAGAIAGTPGTLPTGWSLAGSVSGMSTQVVGVGTLSGTAYMDLRFYGTPAATDNLYVAMNTFSASFGQSWTFGINAEIVGGSSANTQLYLSWSEIPAYHIDLQTPLIMPVTNVPVTTQAFWATGPMTQAGTTSAYPILEVGFTSGQAVDITLRIALPFMDNGTIWQGDLTRANGASSRIVWDASGGPTAYGTSTACNGGACGFWRDIAGSIHSIAGNSVNLSNSPIILDTNAQAVRF